MTITDIYWGDGEGGDLGFEINTWEAKQEGCLAIQVNSKLGTKGLVATLDPESCMAFAIHLFNHAAKNGVKIP